MKKNYRKQKLRTILFIWLAVIMVIAVVVASAAGLLLQNHYQKRQAFSVISDYLEKNIKSIDIDEYINTYFDEWMTDIIEAEGTSSRDGYYDNDALTRITTHNKGYLNEVSIVDQNGIITYSSNPEMLGIDIRSSERLAPFACLLEGEESYSEPFDKSPFNDSVKIAYTGRTFTDKSGFMLWGIDEDDYQHFCKNTIILSTEDVKIGMTGYLINCDLNKNITCATEDIQDTVGEKFTEESVLPEEEGTIKESVCNLYGEDCYVGAIKTPNYYVIGVYPVAEADQFKLQNNLLFAALILLVLIVFFIALFVMLKKIVIKGVEKTHSSLTRITGGDLEEKVDVRGSLEFEELSSGINDTVDKLKDLIREEDERVKNELLAAKYIQESAVPGNFPPYSDNESFSLFASMNTAEDVGGDFYNFFMVDENTLAIVMADVCGKGLPAALFMMSSDILLQNYTLIKKNPKAAMEEVNRQICAENSGGMFVTVWLGILNLKTGKLTAVNAGHEKPAIKSPDGSFELYKDKHGLMVGYLDYVKYSEYELQLEKGSKLFLYTDGVAEATNAKGELFGTDRMIEALRTAEDGTPKDILQAVDLAISDFVKDAPQFDDITMLCLEYKGPQE